MMFLVRQSNALSYCAAQFALLSDTLMVRSNDLHVVVALQEVGDFGLAHLGISVAASGSGSAEFEVLLLCGAVAGPFVGKNELLDGAVGVAALHFY